MKKRRVSLSIAILFPLFFAILIGEVGIYFGAYAILTDTIANNARADDLEDLTSVSSELSENNYALPGYAIVPVIQKYEELKPAAPFVPGSEEEKTYIETMTASTSSQLYYSVRTELQRHNTTIAGFFYEDVALNRMVLVCSTNDEAHSAESVFPKRNTTAGEINTAYIGAFFEKPSYFNNTEGFYGETVIDIALGKMFCSSVYLGEVQHPVRRDGKYRVWLVRETSSDVVFDAVPNFTRSFAIASAVMLVVLIAFSYLLLYIIVLRPARKLSEAGNEYIESLKSGEAKDVFSPSKRRTRSEMTDLNDALYFTQEAIRDYAGKVRDSAAYEERIKADLSLAERIQMGMLPVAPLFAEGCSLRGYIRPAREVGGDMYNYFPVGEDSVAFFIGDVSGKGVPAALFMAKTEALLRLMAADLEITRVNEMLCQGNDECLFVTAFIGVLDFKTGELRFVNCGHEPVFLFHDGKYEDLGGEINMPLGCLDDIDFVIEKRKLSKGDRLFLYTDGVSEAMNVDGQMFGRGRILDTLNAATELSGEELLLQMQEEVASFVQQAEQSDDLCMVVLDYARQDALSFPPDRDGLSLVAPFVDNFLKNDKETLGSLINIVLDEFCSNIVFYGQADGKPVHLILCDNGKAIDVSLIDEGIPFDPTKEVPERDPEKPGGLGIMLAKEMTDGLHYRRIGDKNILHFLKKREG